MQLELLRRRSDIDVVRDDMELIWSGQSMPPALRAVLNRGAAGLGKIADALQQFWSTGLEPHWQRIRGVLEDDVAHRAATIVNDGLYNLLAELHSQTSVQDTVLTIDKPNHENQTYASDELILVPSVFCQPNLIFDHDGNGALVLIYGARGVGRTWEGMARDTESADHLTRLLGRTGPSFCSG